MAGLGLRMVGVLRGGRDGELIQARKRFQWILVDRRSLFPYFIFLVSKYLSHIDHTLGWFRVRNGC